MGQSNTLNLRSTTADLLSCVAMYLAVCSLSLTVRPLIKP